MRGTMAAVLVLALGACAEHTGWNPNYSLGDRPFGESLNRDTPYTRYLTHREAALQGRVEPSRTIPIARPFKAPTAEEIADLRARVNGTAVGEALTAVPDRLVGVVDACVRSANGSRYFL